MTTSINQQQQFIAIGDIHGHFDRLQALWAHIKEIPNFDSYTVVFLGDYINRGPKTRQVIEFLVNLKASRPNTFFLMGNHDFGLASFLGLLPGCEEGVSFRNTWDNEAVLASDKAKSWYTGEGSETMHVQGRYFGGINWRAIPTFRSYEAEPRSRSSLLTAMPETHKQFFRDLLFVHEIPDFVFVHGGLFSQKARPRMSIEEQLVLLRRRDCVALGTPRHLFVHEPLYHAPKELKATDLVIVSGHHGYVGFSRNRIVIDNIGAKDDQELMCFLHPQFCLMRESGTKSNVNRSEVYPEYPPPVTRKSSKSAAKPDPTANASA